MGIPLKRRVGCFFQVGCLRCGNLSAPAGSRSILHDMDERKNHGPPRGHATRYALMVEAERRVRAGEVRAHVAKDLQIAASTMAVWAARGRWRKTDLRREAAGLPPLPQPYYARDGRNVTDGSGAAQSHKRTETCDLEVEIKALGEAARLAFDEGDLARAETKLKAARRLSRLADGLVRFAPVAPTDPLDLKSDEEMREEIRRMVGLK